jgi:hypothetical protein
VHRPGGQGTVQHSAFWVAKPLLFATGCGDPNTVMFVGTIDLKEIVAQ